MIRKTVAAVCAFAAGVMTAPLAAIDDAAKHPLPDWLRHRRATLRTEAEGAKRQIDNEFHIPTAGRAGSAETAEAKDAAVRPEVKR